MGKFEILDAILDRGNVYLLTSDVVAGGISKPTLASYVKCRSLERAEREIHFSDEL